MTGTLKTVLGKENGGVTKDHFPEASTVVRAGAVGRDPMGPGSNHFIMEFRGEGDSRGGTGGAFRSSRETANSKEYKKFNILTTERAMLGGTN